jgi:PAS domain S-box-containing protein
MTIGRQMPVPTAHRRSPEDVDRTIANLTRRVNQLQTTVATLLAERNRAELFARRAATQGLAEVQSGPARLLQRVIDSLEGRMCILTEDGTVLGTNRLWDEAATQLDLPGSGIGSHIFSLTRSLPVDPPDLQRLHDALLSVLVGDEKHAEAKLRWMWAGVNEHVVVRVHAVTDHDQAKAVLSIVDITTAMTTQAELQRITRRAQLLALVAEHTDNAVVIQDSAGRIEWVNDAFCRLTGHHEEGVIGKTRMDLWQGPFVSTPRFRELVEEIAAGHSVDVEIPAQSTAGRHYWTHLQVQPVLVDGEIARYVGVERDITERRIAEERLRATNQQVRTLADEIAAEKALLDGVLASIPHLVYWKVADPAADVLDTDPAEPGGADQRLHYSGVNQAFLTVRAIKHQHQVIGQSEDMLPVQDELSALLPGIEAEVIASGVPQLDLRVDLHTGSGQCRELLLSVLPYGDGSPEHGETTGVIGVAADVTHLSELERHLAQASRLESIGQLAAGIAHEINTPVQYVSDNTRFVAGSVGTVLAALRGIAAVLAETGPDDQGTTPDEGAVPGAVPGAETGTCAALARVRELASAPDLDFLDAEIPSALAQSQEGLQRVAEIVKAMKDYSHPGVGRAAADVNRAVESTVKVCRNEWKYVAELELDLDPDLPPIPCYEGELKQVLLNIIINAAHAIGDHRESTGATDLGRIRVGTRRVGDSAHLVIQDDGPGMPEDVRRRVFDPFFTTKPVGKGTGQGLSMAYASIVTKHGGQLTVDSAPGQGATFTIALPLTVTEERPA